MRLIIDEDLSLDFEKLGTCCGNPSILEFDLVSFVNYLEEINPYYLYFDRQKSQWKFGGPCSKIFYEARKKIVELLT